MNDNYFDQNFADCCGIILKKLREYANSIDFRLEDKDHHDARMYSIDELTNESESIDLMTFARKFSITKDIYLNIDSLNTKIEKNIFAMMKAMYFEFSMPIKIEKLENNLHSIDCQNEPFKYYKYLISIENDFLMRVFLRHDPNKISEYSIESEKDSIVVEISILCESVEESIKTERLNKILSGEQKPKWIK